jgi:hypothetical protein
MANTITSQTLVDDNRISVVKVNITSDGSGETTDGIIYNASNFTPSITGLYTKNKLEKIQYHLHLFSGTLYWDASSPVQLINLNSNYPDRQCYRYLGGLPNNGGTGQTGNILLTTQGLSSAPSGTTGEIILYVVKR